MKTQKASLTLGPLLFHWQGEQWRDFYFKIADEAAVDRVHLGEVACARRLPFFAKYIVPVADRLKAAGKEVVLSTLALAQSERESDMAQELVINQVDAAMEINDLFSSAILKGKAHVVGPFVNCYNEGTLAFLAERGAKRVCMAAELSSSAIFAMAATGLAEIEVQAFGRMPLALSARCYHARSRNLPKSDCQYVCAEDPDGMDVETMDGKAFLAINGTQTMSFRYLNLLREMDALKAGGVSSFRLWPHDCDMVRVTEIFRARLDQTISAEEADEQLFETIPWAEFANGYIHGVAGYEEVAGDLS